MWKIAVTLVWLSAFAAAALAAQKWPSIGTFAIPDGGTAATRHGDYWTARQKTLFSAAQRSASGASFRSELDVYAYDCQGNRTALVSYTRYEGENLAGALMDKMERSSPSEYEWVTPASGGVLEAAKKIVCSFAAMRSR
jgi:hypothetical protein